MLILIFILPIVAGVLNPFSGDARHSLLSAFRSFGIVTGIILSVWLTTEILSDKENWFMTLLFKAAPKLKESYSNNDVLANIIVASAIIFLIYSVIKLLAIPLYKAFIPLSDRISSSIDSMSSASKRTAGGLWKLPKSVLMVLVFALILNFYSSYDKNQDLGGYIDDSRAYRIIDDNVIKPALSSSAAGKVPALFNSALKNTISNISLNKLTAIAYINGTSLEDAVRSSDEIDGMTKKIVLKEEDDKKKANLIYKWICDNIKFDYNKAKIIANNPADAESGAVEAFTSRRGVCYDYSCLYVSMCRAAGLKVRLITGIAYNGTAWADHAWNQVYDPDEKRWVDVDTTFGALGGNYFDSQNFSKDHEGGEVFGEWQSE